MANLAANKPEDALAEGTSVGSWRRSDPLRGVTLLAIPLAAAGCSHSPTLNLFGSYFPAWMVCAALGVIAAVLIRQILRVAGVHEYVVAPALTYVGFAVAGALLLWLLWFSR
jgi:YtcA family